MGQRVVAVNRPVRGDALISLEADEVKALFGAVPVALTQGEPRMAMRMTRRNLALVLVVMALALLIEES